MYGPQSDDLGDERSPRLPRSKKPVKQSMSDATEEIDLSENFSTPSSPNIEYFSRDGRINIQRKTRPEITDLTYTLAAQYVEEARMGRNLEFLTTEKHIKSYQLFHHFGLKFLLYLFIFIHLSLAMFEDPAIKGLEAGYAVTLGIESVCMLVYIVRVGHMCHYSSASVFWFDRKNLVTIGCIVLILIDMISYVIVKQIGLYTVRWSRVLRPLLFISFPEGRQLRLSFRNIRRTLPGILNVLILFLFSLFIFSFMFYKMFKRRYWKYSNGTPYFDTYWNVFFDLYVLVTTANNPDVMMPAYDVSRFYVPFFIIFVFVNIYILMSILMAVIYNNYKSHLKNEVMDAIANRNKHMTESFNLLKEPKEGSFILTKERFAEVVRRVPGKRSDKLISILWLVLDDKGKGYVNLLQYIKLADLLKVEVVEITDRSTLIEKCIPSIYNSKPSLFLQKCVRHKIFRWSFDFLILINALMIALNIEEAEWYLLALFMLEIILKIYTFGFREFFRKGWNVFDFIVVTLAFGWGIAEEVTLELHESRTALDVLLVLRVLRIVKLITAIQSFRLITQTIGNLLPSIGVYLAVMLLFYYIFAIIGMEIFQGVMDYSMYNQSDPMSLVCHNPKLNGSDFAALHYCRNNFNDILSSFILLYELTVVNQWHVLASGFAEVTSQWAKLYFIAFHVTCVLIVLNIFTAFVLEAFFLEYTFSQGKLANLLAAKINEMGLGYGSKPLGKKADSKKEQAEGSTYQELDGDHESQQVEYEPSTLPKHFKFADMSSQTTVRFRLKKSFKNAEVLLQKMFEHEIPEDIGINENFF